MTLSHLLRVTHWKMAKLGILPEVDLGPKSLFWATGALWNLSNVCWTKEDGNGRIILHDLRSEIRFMGRS